MLGKRKKSIKVKSTTEKLTNFLNVIINVKLMAEKVTNYLNVMVKVKSMAEKLLIS